jgi:hypothetical protein
MAPRAGRSIAALLFLGATALVLSYTATQIGQRTERAETPEAPGGWPPLAYADRFGVTGHVEQMAAAMAAGLPFGSYATWRLQVEPEQPNGAFFWQMIRVSETGPVPSLAEIDAAIASAPGSTWLIGNEPDVIHQDNVTPQRYAAIYHDLYHHIKERDPTAHVAIAGVAQPTPLRLAYLDIVLDTYQERYGAPMPVDVWNVHAFILREEHDSWGVDIPPGMDDMLATKYEIGDHLDLDIFRAFIVDFRAWMAERGYADRPLLVSEYGFLMPYEYGFSEAQVIDFMTAAFDFFISARNDTGLAADDHRLVQWWLWFILEDDTGEYRPTYLFDREAGALTPLGEAYASYVRNHGP